MKLPKTALALAIACAFASAHAAEAPNAAAGPDAGQAKKLETVSVIGQGSTRQVQRISVLDVEVHPPGTSPLQLLDKLPGVHTESSDPFGAYEWSERISLRGFNQNRLGFTLDNIPLGDMSYGNNNGLHISRAIISENLAGAELAEGIGALGTASTSDLGGTVQFYSVDPAPEYGVTVGQTVGSDSATRTYARLDTGDHGGLAMALSGVHASIDKWKGYGTQSYDQFNGKAVYQLGSDSTLSALVTTSDRVEIDYQDLSLDSQRRLGWNWDNYQPDWNRAVAAAYCLPSNGNLGACQFTGGVNSVDDAYYSANGQRKDRLVGLNGDFALADHLRLKSTAYYHNDRGQGHWWTPYVPSSATVPISIRTTEYGIDRAGLINALHYDLGANSLEAGFWYERSNLNVQRNFYFVPGPVSDTYFLRDPNYRQWYLHFLTLTRQFYLQDTLHLMDDKLKIDVGFKAPSTTTVSTPVLGGYAAGQLQAKSNFLPSLGFNYKLDAGDEVFGSVARNLAAFQPGVTGPFATSQAAFNAFAGNLKPERSRTVEGGLRRFAADYEASLALYDVKFSNRLLSISQCAGIVGCANAFANVGSVSSRGAELSFIWKGIEHLRWYNSLSYNRSRYDNNYSTGGVLIATAGKVPVDTPKLLFATDLTWKQNGWTLHAGAKYTGSRYYTYLNDAGVPAFWLVNASVGYDFGRVAGLKGLEATLYVDNLLDQRYFATVGSNGFVVSDPQGLYYTLQAGAPRSAFLNVTARF